MVKAWDQSTGKKKRHPESHQTVLHFLFLGSLKFLVGHLYTWTLFSIYNALPSPLHLGFSLASWACPAVHLQPNHWWQSLDVWAPLSLIPAYRKPYCCQASKWANRQVRILPQWTMQVERQRKKVETFLCNALCSLFFNAEMPEPWWADLHINIPFAIFLGSSLPNRNPWNRKWFQQHSPLWIPGSGPAQTWRTHWSWLPLLPSSWLSWGPFLAQRQERWSRNYTFVQVKLHVRRDE